MKRWSPVPTISRYNACMPRALAEKECSLLHRLRVFEALHTPVGAFARQARLLDD